MWLKSLNPQAHSAAISHVRYSVFYLYKDTSQMTMKEGKGYWGRVLPLQRHQSTDHARGQGLQGKGFTHTKTPVERLRGGEGIQGVRWGVGGGGGGLCSISGPTNTLHQLTM